MVIKAAFAELARTDPQAVLAALHPGTVHARVLDTLHPEHSGGLGADDGRRLPW
ncbi:Rossmann-fold NAD(P)-binding domain-containing protein [Pulveribacter suum]|uniref:hypothetical protein n=1 Tax=Pulveribacter suum TaxID=2116657 RepID=UPI003867E49E